MITPPLSESATSTPREAVRLVVEAAEEIDGRLHHLRERATRLLTDRDAAWLLRRHAHRAEHLHAIEVALGLQGR